MNTAMILKVWHYLGLLVGGLGFASTELAPLAAGSGSAHAVAVVTAVGVVSATATTIMSKIANDKVVLAMVNSPIAPTPVGFGIPTPTAPASIGTAPLTAQNVTDLLVKNANQFQAVAEATKS